MGEQIYATFEGPGPNVATASGPLAIVPDVASASTNANNSGKGRSSALVMDERRRLRVSNEAARSGVAFTAGSQQIQTKASRKVWISTAGTLVVRLVDDSADVTLLNVPIGMLELAIAIVQAGTTAVGVLLF